MGTSLGEVSGTKSTVDQWVRFAVLASISRKLHLLNGIALAVINNLSYGIEFYCTIYWLGN